METLYVRIGFLVLLRFCGVGASTGSLIHSYRAQDCRKTASASPQTPPMHQIRPPPNSCKPKDAATKRPTVRCTKRYVHALHTFKHFLRTPKMFSCSSNLTYLARCSKGLAGGVRYKKDRTVVDQSSKPKSRRPVARTSGFKFEKIHCRCNKPSLLSPAMLSRRPTTSLRDAMTPRLL